MDRFVFWTKCKRPQIILLSFVFKLNSIVSFFYCFCIWSRLFYFTYRLRQSNCKVKVFIYRSQLTKKLLKENVMMILLQSCVNIWVLWNCTLPTWFVLRNAHVYGLLTYLNRLTHKIGHHYCCLTKKMRKKWIKQYFTQNV